MTLEQCEPKPALSLAEELQALPPSNRYRKNPITSCPKIMAEWEQVKKLILAGGLKHVTYSDMRKLINKKFNINISQATFCRFLAKEGITKTNE